MLELSLLTAYIIVTAATLFIACKLLFAFSHFTMRGHTSLSRSINDLPSVSVCIPARNETHAMTQCLEGVISSKYPKLEIIVLDDESADNTSILIKSFAHAGVRFIEGSALPEGWLGKNHALQGLLRESSGKYILYLDVDTRLQPDTIGQLVAYAMAEDARMVSVMPQRNDGWRLSALFSPLRYFWELVFHRARVPATSSAIWLVDRHELLELDGFRNFALEVQPEARVAASMALTSQYRFLISTPDLGVTYEKKWLSQVETNIRLLYPRFGGRLWLGVLGLIALVCIWLPIPFIVYGLLSEWTIVQIVAFWHLCIFIAMYGLFLSRTWGKHWWMAIVLWPAVLTQEVIILTVSMIKYLQGSVTWKGRPVLAPKVVRQIERLVES